MLHSDAGPDEKSRGIVYTIVVAGGSGIRFGERKQFLDLGGKSVLDRSVATALAASDRVVIVVPADAVLDVAETVRGDDRVSVVAGGATRAASVRAGLEALIGVGSDAIVLIHDAARPLASRDLYQRLIAAIGPDCSAAVPAVELADTIRSVDGGTVDRTSLRAVQTPQAFRAETILAAHAGGREATDDASLAEAELGLKVKVIDGESHNRKITTPFDMAAARAHLADNVGSASDDGPAKDTIQ